MHYASAEKGRAIWERFTEQINDKWETSMLHVINLATDGGAKYESGGKHFTADVSAGYDLYHIVLAIKPLYGAQIAREVYATMKGEGFECGLGVLKEYRDYFFEQDGDERYLEIYEFIAAHADQIKTAFAYNLGCAEGTNAHIIKERMKGRGIAWGSGLEPMARLRAHRASGGRIPIRSRTPDCDLVNISTARTLAQIESSIARLESKAKAMNRTTKEQPEQIYYRQAHIAHTKAIEANRSLLHLWN
jgi:hypothetical protein